MIIMNEFFSAAGLQAVAAAGEGDAAGRGRHRRQAAHHGGPQVQHPQVGAGGLRPGHDPPEPRQPQPGIRGLQLPVGGAVVRLCVQVFKKKKTLCCCSGERRGRRWLPWQQHTAGNQNH